MTPEIEVCGKLAEILRGFEAPEEVKTKIARRAGAVVPNKISHEQVEKVIVENMPRGLPDWETISDKLGEAVNRAYKGKKPFR